MLPVFPLQTKEYERRVESGFSWEACLLCAKPIKNLKTAPVVTLDVAKFALVTPEEEASGQHPESGAAYIGPDCARNNKEALAPYLRRRK